MNPKTISLFIIGLVVLAVVAFGGCGGEEVTPAPPKPGEWTASTEFGELGFTVNSDSTGIAKVSFDFAEFECGGVQVSGGISVENPSLWPITGGQFTVDAYVRPWDIVIRGEFDETGTQASGTWEITGTTCSGTWESSRAS